MMTAMMMERVEALRVLVADGMRYDLLTDLLARRADLPSMSTLRRYDLLTVVRTEEREETMTAEEFEPDMEYDDHADEWDWDEERELWVCSYTVRYYGLR